MDLKNSYVYRGIRRAALQRLFSWKRVLSCFCLLIFIVFLLAFFSPSGSGNRKDRMPEFFLIVLVFGLWFLVDIVDIIRNVAALIFPENSIAATRYADIISFKKICASVEAQLLQPLIDFDHSGVIALADFIIYKRYGDFAVIPYCAIKNISPGVIKWAGLWPKINTVVIQNDLGQSHTIKCKNAEKRDQIFYELDDALQTSRQKRQYAAKMGRETQPC